MTRAASVCRECGCDGSHLMGCAFAPFGTGATKNPYHLFFAHKEEEVSCPKCGAQKGQECLNLRNLAYVVAKPHKERTLNYEGRYVHPRDKPQ